MLHIQVSAPVTVLGDEARLIQALINVLDNAIIYSNAGGHVTVSVEQKSI